MIEVTAEIVRDLLDYNPETGVFRWKFRDRKWFESVNDRFWKIWNNRFAGKLAGSFDKKGYWVVVIFHKHYKAHRLAWLYVYGEWPQNHIDHINHQTDDNRLENLREVTRFQNQWNGSIQTGTSSQYKGVCWYKNYNKWKAQINVNGKKKHLGYFINPIDAARAYDRAALKYFGEYANLNFPIEDYLNELH